MITRSARRLASDFVDLLDHLQRVAETISRGVGESGRHQRVGDRVERRLRGDFDEGVVKRGWFDFLTGHCREPRDPVVYQGSPACVHLGVGATEPRRFLRLPGHTCGGCDEPAGDYNRDVSDGTRHDLQPLCERVG